MTYLTNAIAIVFCGGSGALLAWRLVAAVGWTGLPAALAATLLAMVFAFAFYCGGIAAAKGLTLRK